jgi:general L-amino acid transport system substrate-binding protein
MRVLLASLFIQLLAMTAAPAQTLTAIRAAGHLDCGTVAAVEDWSSETTHGDLSTFGKEICEAVAVAVLGTNAGLQIHTYPAEAEALSGLKSGAIHLAVGVSPGITTAVNGGVTFGLPIFYDTQRFLVAKSSGITSLEGLRDKLVCAMNLTRPQEVLNEEMAARHIPFGLQAHSEVGEMVIAVAGRRCAAGTAMETWLADARADFPANAPPFEFLPERIGLEPIVPAWRTDDPLFGLVVNATLSALIEAEALGITRDNVKAASGRTDLRTTRLLGQDSPTAKTLGLAPGWVQAVIGVTGNYGEIFERTIGRPLHLERGFNALWTHGGLMRPDAIE